MLLNKHTIREYLQTPDPEPLFQAARDLRQEACGRTVTIRSILEFSNFCCRDCRYCGLRLSNDRLHRYRMEKEEIVEVACSIIERGIQTVVMQSGDDFAYTGQELADIISAVKHVHPNAAITLSVGERPFEDYRAFREAGADRYLLKHETINANLYAAHHPGKTLKERLACLMELKRLGFQIGTGFIVSLPGQTLEHLIDEILFFQELQPDMAGISPFIPQSDTPLRNEPMGSLDMTLRMIALARLVTRDTHLPATTALATAEPESGYKDGLKAGANVIMLGETPEHYRNDYKIYDDKFRTNLPSIKRIIEANGDVMCLDRGDSLKQKS